MEKLKRGRKPINERDKVVRLDFYTKSAYIDKLGKSKAKELAKELFEMYIEHLNNNKKNGN